jgi:hypothetical protein
MPESAKRSNKYIYFNIQPEHYFHTFHYNIKLDVVYFQRQEKRERHLQQAAHLDLVFSVWCQKVLQEKKTVDTFYIEQS